MATNNGEDAMVAVDALEDVVLPEIVSRKLTLTTISGICLNVPCYRGFASARVLSSISQPDVYFQYSNPEGTQRDLSVDKARRAYEYMSVKRIRAKRDLRFFTEIVLNIRNPDVISTRLFKNGTAKLTILLDQLGDNAEDPDISRVEGNHRLAYARGTATKDPLDVPMSFCIIIGMPKLMEAKLFRDINSNQKPMNTSHLDNIELQLSSYGSGPANEYTRIADRLSRDVKSPFLDIVYRGGRKLVGTHFAVSLRTLSNLTRLLLLQSHKLSSLEIDDRYIVVRSFWQAVAAAFPAEWEDTRRRHLMMKSAGLSALAMLGGRLLDELAFSGRLGTVKDYIMPLAGVVDWKTSGPLQGLNGLGGANIIYRKHLLPHVELLHFRHGEALRAQVDQLKR